MAQRTNRSEAPLQTAVLDALDLPVAAVGRDGRILMANPSFRRLFRSAGGDGDCDPGSVRLPPVVQELIDRHAGRMTGFEATDLVYTETGRSLPLRLTGRPIAQTDLQPAFLLITARPRNDDTAKPERQAGGDGWLHDALAALPHKTWVVEPAGRVVFSNRALLDYIGLPLPAEREPRDRMIFHPDDLVTLERIRSKSWAAGLNFDVELRMRRRDGVWRWHHIAVTLLTETGHGTLWLVMATDIHELRTTTDELRVAEERLTLAQSVGRIGMWDWCIATGARVFNDVYFELLGIEPQPAHTRDDLLATVYEEDRAAIAAKLDAAIMGQSEYRIEYRIRRADGELRWMSARGAALQDANGTPIRFLGVLIDVTEAKEGAADRERLMRQIADQLQELELLYHTAPIGLAMVDRDMRFQRINSQLASINGHSVEEHLGRTAWELVPDLRHSVEPHFRYVMDRNDALKDVEISGETPAQPGVTRYWLEQFYPLPDASGFVRGVGIICEEVTARKLAERLLRESEERLRLATEAAEIGVFEWDPTTDTTVFLNTRMKELLGVETGVDRATFVSQHVHPEDRTRLGEALDSDEIHEGRTLRLACRLRAREGLEWRHVEFAGEFKFDHEQKRYRFLGVARDVTVRKQADETQRLLIAELNHRVKNTLATVQAIANQTLRRSKTPEDFVEALTGRLQALSRAHNLLTETTWTGADLSRLIREQLAMGNTQDPRIELAGPQLTLPPPVALRLGLVVHELGTNARKYGALSAPSGRVQVSWRREAQESHDLLVLSWSENGGPELSAPDHRGFGTRLIEASMTALGGSAQMSYPVTGLQCDLRLPLT